MNQPLDTQANRDAAKKARDGRNIALGLGLVAFVIMVFVVTLVRLGANVAHPHP
ncbi:hypothetical protein [Caulobacter sp. FWC2]|uniref:hypothetical protein n=1 Tax=Caulobacter sp. FWC2 TaxID=69664 RepID=UPI000C151441|nr:hypothetical protein [Caulobacter sp. FWC2]PIB90377.1 hypothetical protein CSW62_01625 [Caulobacter sp. FWC2]